MPIIKNNKNIAKILSNNVGFGKVYKNSILYFGGTGTPPAPPSTTPLYRADNGDIMLKAGTYKASVMNFETGEQSIQDYQVSENTKVDWTIPQEYNNIEATLIAKEKQVVPAVAADLPIPAVGNFNIAAEPVAWSASNWGSREYRQDQTSGIPNTEFTINFSKSRFYTGYAGILESGNNTCTYKVRHLMSFKVPETASYKFNYSLSEGPLINSSDKSPITFKLYKKSDNSLLYTASGTTSYRSSNDTMYATLSFTGDDLALTKDDELYADITIDKVVRRGGSNVSGFLNTALNFGQYLQSIYSTPNGSQQVTLMIDKFGDNPAHISLQEYHEGMEDRYPNGLTGTINWTNGAVSSIT